MSAYSVELKTNNLSDFQVFPDENDFMKIKITTSNKLIYAIKRSFEPYNKVYIPENLEYGRSISAWKWSPYLACYYCA